MPTDLLNGSPPIEVRKKDLKEYFLLKNRIRVGRACLFDDLPPGLLAALAALPSPTILVRPLHREFAKIAKHII